MHHVQDPLLMDIPPGDLPNNPRAPSPPPPPPPSEEPQEAAPAANPAPPDTAALPYGAERRLLRHAKRIAAEYREAARQVAELDSAEPEAEAAAAAADTAAAADATTANTADTAATAALPKKPSQEKARPRQPRGPPPGKRAADRAADDLADLSLAARYEEPTSVQHLLMPHAFVEAATYGP